jgi:hypothetical protein
MGGAEAEAGRGDDTGAPAALEPRHGGQLMALLAAAVRLGGNASYPGVFQPFGGTGLEEKPELRSVLSALAGYEL